MSDTASLRKQLRIKAGVAKRYHKELKLYIQEKEQYTIKLHNLEAEDPDKQVDQEGEEGNREWHLKNLKNMMTETDKLVELCTSNVSTASQDLRDLVTAAEKDPNLAENAEFLTAKETLELISV